MMWVKRGRQENVLIFKNEDVQTIRIYLDIMSDKWKVILSLNNGNKEYLDFKTKDGALKFIFQLGIVDFENMLEWADYDEQYETEEE